MSSISFENHTLICLSGKNGHGKSALLDAITWAVWGAARKIQNSVRPDHGLVKLGQSSMMVIFDCIINSCAYRIKREFEFVYGKPKTTLDLGIIESDGTIHSLTEKTIRDTQTRIENIIGLDYETFINSSFLRQGNANEFSKRSPKERKEIISSILGLGTYDTIKKAALDKGKKAAQESNTIKALLTHTHQEKETVTTLLNAYPIFCNYLEQITTEYKNRKIELAAIHSQVMQQQKAHEMYCNTVQEYAIKQKLYIQKIDLLKNTVTEWRIFRKTSFDNAAYTRLKNELCLQESLYMQAQKEFTTFIAIKEQIQSWEQTGTAAQNRLMQQQIQQDTEQKIVFERLENTLNSLKEQMKNIAIQSTAHKQELELLQKKK